MKLKNKYLSGKSKVNEPDFLENKIRHPVFCFRYLHKDYHIDKCETDEKISLLERIVKLSGLTWQEIEYSSRHTFGSEKIHRDAIKQDLPNEITDDVPFFLALRFCGKKPFVGFRNKFIFHVLYIDRDFTLYKH